MKVHDFDRIALGARGWPQGDHVSRRSTSGPACTSRISRSESVTTCRAAADRWSVDSLGLDPAAVRRWVDDVTWLRGLAASLVHDPDEAADVAGEVWVEALERRPEVDDTRPLRPWLAVVLQRLVARRRRERTARRERERIAARAEAVHGADRAIERIELQRRLADAVLALEEPYRSAVVLRHLERLSPAQIAQRQKCSVEAARQRVTRGLQRLRARLDREFDGGRDAWRALLLPFALRAPLAEGGVLAGIFLMGGKLMLGLAAAAAAVCLWMWGPWRTGHEAWLAILEPDGAAALEVPTSRGALSVPDLAIAPKTQSRRALAEALRLSGTVADSSGRPVSRVHLDFSLPADETFVAESAVSDASGQFESLLPVDWDVEQPVEALARAPGFVVTSVSMRADETSLITLRRLPRVEVRVVTSDGSIPKGEVELTIRKPKPLDRESERFIVELEADGVARSGPLEPGTLIRARVDAKGYCGVDSYRSYELAGDQRLSLDFSPVPGVTLRGTVRSELTGRPVAGAVVGTRQGTNNSAFGRRATVTDSAGGFELRGVAPTEQQFVASRPNLNALYSLDVEAPGFMLPPDRRVVLIHAANKPGPALVEHIELLVIPTSASMTGTLRWADGRACGGLFRVRAVDSLGNLFEASCGDGCGYFFNALPPDELRVFATPQRSDLLPAMATATLRLRANERRELALVLQKNSGAIEGRVVGCQGRDLAQLYVDAHAFIEQSGKRVWLDGHTELTDGQGRFRFENLSAGMYDLSVDGEIDGKSLGCWPPVLQVELDEGEVSRPVEIQVEPAAFYGGRLQPWPPADTAQPVLLELIHAEVGSVATVWAREDGSFQLPGVFGAEYVIVARQGDRELGRLPTPKLGARDLIVPLVR